MLCPAFDADEPGAAALITYFNVHRQVDAGSVHECAALIQAWADSITIPSLNETRLNEEIRAWQQGEL